MKIHEFQAKQLLEICAWLVVPRRTSNARTVDQAVSKLTAKLASELCVVKAQIHAGGRGKAGGVKLVKQRRARRARCGRRRSWARRLVTHQTGPEGQLVRRLWVEQGSDDRRQEYYIGIVDRSRVAATGDDGLVRGRDGDRRGRREDSREDLEGCLLGPTEGLGRQRGRPKRLAQGHWHPGDDLVDQCRPLLGGAGSKVFCELDCSLAEINPLVTTKDGRSCSRSTQDQLRRERALPAQGDPDRDCATSHEEDAKEIEASKYDLSYIALDGNIGCMVNGAGLAMATMDVIQLYGGQPGELPRRGWGRHDREVSRPRSASCSPTTTSKAVLVNIFGGIMKCDVIAQGVIEAVKQRGPHACRSWCASRAPTWKQARSSWPTPGLNRSWPPTDLDDAAKQGLQAVEA